MPNCKKCQTDFPFRMLVDGEMRSLTKRRFCLQCSPFKGHNTRNLVPSELEVQGLKACGKCKLVLPLEEFRPRYVGRRAGSLTSYCKSCADHGTLQKAQKIKASAVAYKGGCCVCCGYDRYVGALEFHHLDPTKKDFRISSYRKRYLSSKGELMDALKEELDKCLLVCSCCHREIHAGVRCDGHLS